MIDKVAQDEVVTPKEIFNDIAKIYTKLGKKLWELQRMFERGLKK